jgi:hypothetical protein
MVGQMCIHEFLIYWPQWVPFKQVSAIAGLVDDCCAPAADPVLLTGAMQSVIQDKEVKAHVFQHTTGCVLTPDKMQFKFIDNKGVVPMQMIFCLKEKNAK